MTDFFTQIFSDECEQFSVIIEDDGKVCYAYLLYEGNIQGDVWLYNQAETPLVTDFSDREEMPFLNPAEFVKVGIGTDPLSSEEQVKVEWFFNDDSGGLKEAQIFIHDKLIAGIRRGARPGWSMNVKKDGPLANTFDTGYRDKDVNDRFQNYG